MEPGEVLDSVLVAMVEFVDETTTGGTRVAWELEIFEERLALRELIRRRVFQEVAEFNARPGRPFRGLVTPRAVERALNPATAPSRVDAEEQFRVAVEAFGRNGFVVLVGDRQVEDLDAIVELRAPTQVTFLKLVALVGG